MAFQLFFLHLMFIWLRPLLYSKSCWISTTNVGKLLDVKKKQLQSIVLGRHTNKLGSMHMQSHINDFRVVVQFAGNDVQDTTQSTMRNLPGVRQTWMESRFLFAIGQSALNVPSMESWLNIFLGRTERAGLQRISIMRSPGWPARCPKGPFHCTRISTGGQ